MLDRSKMSKNYKRGSHYKHYLSVHLILTVKYRRDILKFFGEELIVKINDIATTSNFKVKEAQHDNNHIHLLIDFDPSISVSQICRRIKSQTTMWAWDNHEGTCRKYFWKPGRKFLWSDGYFVCSVGDASRERIVEYIANQGK